MVMESGLKEGVIMPIKDLNKCILNEEYQNKMITIREKLEELNALVVEYEEHLPALCNTKIELENALESFDIEEKHYGMKSEFQKKNGGRYYEINR